jgi:DNA (cytosine-5)-methyltransferase 1
VKALSLFSGIGGIDLACEWAGIETVAFCEREPFPQKVLKKHWPDVPINGDVFTMNRRWLEDNGIDTGTIGLIHAGYPCQGESHAGDRKGEEDERWLWPETARTLEEITPDWFVGENVSGHITMGLDTVLTDLGRLRYTAQTFHIPALAVDADHERYRVFVVAYSDKKSGLQAHQAARAIREKWGHGKMLVGVVGDRFPDLIGQYLDPRFQESLMGFPTGWTDVTHSETQ